MLTNKRRDKFTCNLGFTQWLYEFIMMFAWLGQELRGHTHLSPSPFLRIPRDFEPSGRLVGPVSDETVIALHKGYEENARKNVAFLSY